MSITRREFGRLALTSTTLALLPLKAFAGSLGNFELLGNGDDSKGHIHGDSSPHHVSHGDPKFIKIHWDCDWKKDTHMTWEHVDGTRVELPSDLVLPHGSVDVLVDYNGNWVYSGQFQGDPEFVYDGDFAFGLKSDSLGHLLGFTDKGRIDGQYSWTRQGQSGIIKDLWPDVVKGYTWYSSANFKPYHKPDHHHFQPVPPPAPSGGGGGGNSAGRDVLNVLTGGIASWF
jgi:hypothetical protein